MNPRPGTQQALQHITLNPNATRGDTEHSSIRDIRDYILAQHGGWRNAERYLVGQSHLLFGSPQAVILMSEATPALPVLRVAVGSEAEGKNLFFLQRD